MTQAEAIAKVKAEATKSNAVLLAESDHEQIGVFPAHHSMLFAAPTPKGQVRLSVNVMLDGSVTRRVL